MADSDGEYMASDDDMPVARGGRSGTRKSRPAERAAWEASVHDREKPMVGVDVPGAIGSNLRLQREERMRGRSVATLSQCMRAQNSNKLTDYGRTHSLSSEV